LGVYIVSVLCNIDEENEGYTYASWRFTIYHNALANFGETLTLDDVIVEDEATQARAGGSHTIY
jgi:hypothetical protein